MRLALGIVLAVAMAVHGQKGRAEPGGDVEVPGARGIGQQKARADGGGAEKNASAALLGRYLRAGGFPADAKLMPRIPTVLFVIT